jgi:DNA-directed RNA polymerase specialized sigma24 family protein
MTHDTAQFEAAVGRALQPLAPVAVLLTDDGVTAEHLLATALSARRALEDPDTALRALVHGRPAASDRRRVIETLGAPDRGAADEDAALAAALSGLSGRARAAVVLWAVTGLSGADLARVLGGDPETVAAETAAALEQLRDELARLDRSARRERAEYAALYRAPGSTPTEPPAGDVDLPDRLGRLAARRRLPGTTTSRLAEQLLGRRRDRRRGGLRALAAAVALGTLAAATLALRPDPLSTPTPTVSAYAGATRGSLATDDAFLRAVRTFSWPGSLGAPSPGTRRVVFAGDLPGGGGRWVLMSTGGNPSAPAAVAWFTGPTGATPDDLELFSTRAHPDPALPLALTSPATGGLVVVTAPGDRVQVSLRPQIAGDGSVGRTFLPLPTIRGVAVASLPPVVGATATSVRLTVDRAGVPVPAPVPAVVIDGSTPPAPLQLSRLRAQPAPALGDLAVEPQVRDVWGQLGLPARTAAVTLLWAGDLPGPNDRPARLTVAAIEQPSGAVVVTAPFGYAADPSGRAGSSWCGTGVLPAGEPLDQRVVVVPCDISDGTADPEISRFLVVVAARTATTVQLLDESGALLSEHPLQDGVAVVRSPGDVSRVLVTGADGGTSAGTPLLDTELTD